MKGSIKRCLLAVRYPSVGAYLAASLFHWRPRAKAIAQSLNELLSRARSNEAPRVIDLGCGPGLLRREVTRRGLSYVGVDPDSASVRYCRSACDDPRADFVESDAISTDFTYRPGDIVIVNGLAHHLNDHDLSALLGRLRNVQAVVISDHFRSREKTKPIVRLVQNLDRGRYVRDYGRFEEFPAYRLISSTHYPIRIFGVTIWTYFTNVYLPEESGA